MPTRRTSKNTRQVKYGIPTVKQVREHRDAVLKLMPFVPQPGPQTEILYNPAIAKCHEVLCGGSKGGGKTALGRAWIFRGNYEYLKNPRSDADVSYVFHHAYRALVLRRNRDDLNDWVLRFTPLAAKYGGIWKAADSEFEFQSNARVIVAHLADEKAFFSYEGNEIHSLLIEELTHIPKYSLYAAVKKNVRTEYPELRPQVLCTTNPPGPGMGWVKERFINPWKQGNKLIREWQRNPVTGKKEAVFRIFVPMRLSDNKVLLKNDPSYPTRLMADLETDEERRAYIHGDWDAMSGMYFRNFRPDGPHPGDPPEARHVVEPGKMPIMDWWPRMMSMDVGYEHHAVVLKAAIRPEGRLHIYDAVAESHVLSEEWGVRIAQWIYPELQAMMRPVIVLWMSHEAFGQRGDEKTTAEQIEAGINKVIGPNASIIMNEGEDGTKFLEGLKFQTDRARIIIRRAPRQRVDGWKYLHGLMRFTQLPGADKSLYNHEYAQKLMEEEGIEKYSEYRDAFRARPKEVLPRIIIENAPGLAKAIPLGVRQQDGMATGTSTKPNPEDLVKTSDIHDDYRDGVRYMAMGYKHQTEIEPPDVFVDERVKAALKQNPLLDSKAVFEIRVRGYSDYELMNEDFGEDGGFVNVGRGSRGREEVRIVQ